MFRLAARVAVDVAGGACALALTGCGSSGATSTAAANSGLKFAECMRAHGVTNFPDPSAGGGGFQFTPASGLDPQAPAFQRAQKACGGFGPGGGLPPMTEAQKVAALRFAQCMRAHGEPSFPDPVYSQPSGSGGPILALRGMFFAIGPGVDPGSPAFQRAAAACGLRLPSGPGRVRGVKP